LNVKGLLLRSGNALKQGAHQIAGRGIAIDLRKLRAKAMDPVTEALGLPRGGPRQATHGSMP
jgi:hypothetical protein